MAQAKKTRIKATTKAKPKKKTSSGFSSHGISMLLAGIVIGSLGTVMWQGYNSDDSNVGSGIRAVLEQSNQQDGETVQQTTTPVIKPSPQTTNFDFFTVLPEIEVVVREGDEPEKPKPKPTVSEADPEIVAAETKVEAEAVTVKPKSAYMLQAGSYKNADDADRQKAKLAFIGLSSSIQKVTIQGQGDFYRVRLGPFADFSKAATADDRLKQEGIKALLLKISKSG